MALKIYFQIKKKTHVNFVITIFLIVLVAKTNLYVFNAKTHIF